jgi:hypothetical protein
MDSSKSSLPPVIAATADYYAQIFRPRRTRSLRWVVGTLIDELLDAGIDHPLDERFTLGAILSDLGRISGDEELLRATEDWAEQ